MGHASRCIPLIKFYQSQGDTVILASYGESKQFLKKEFPELEHIHLPGIKVRYAKNSFTRLKLAFRFFYFLRQTKKEHTELDKLINDKKIDLVISDNRYGLNSKKAYCIFITHQLFIPAGIFSFIVNRINHSYIKKFNECYVPDFSSENNLSGKLSHGKHNLSNVNFIGPLTRFDQSCEQKESYTYKFTLILSGPEPQKSIFENLVIHKFLQLGEKCCIVNSSHPEKIEKNISYYKTQNTKELFNTINNSEQIICRSGYSSIMDLKILNKKAILVPTPGQTEQEYLADYHKNKYRILLQDEISNFSFEA